MFLSSMFNQVNLLEDALYRFECEDVIGSIVNYLPNSVSCMNESNLAKKMRSSIFVLEEDRNKFKQHLITNRGHSYVSTGGKYISGNDFLNYVLRKNKPVKVTSQKLSMCSILDFAKNLKKFIGDIEYLYGIMAFSDGYWFNLTHPLILTEFLYGNINNNVIDYLYFYEIKEQTPFGEMEYDVTHESSYLEKMDVIYKYVLKAQLASLKKKKEKQEKDDIIYLDMNGTSLKVFVESEDNFLDKSTTFIMPVDKLAKENVIPYYSWILGYRNNSNLYACEIISDSMLSCNISFGADNGTNFYGCCTGKHNFRTLEGIDSLKFANIASPYNSAICVGKDFREFVTANLRFSMKILDKFIQDNERT